MMKVGGGPPVTDPLRRLDQAYGVKIVQPETEAAAAVLDLARLLKGRVLSNDGAGLLTVATDLGSFKASSATPLAVGREFWFQVVQAGASPLLAEAGKTNAVLNLLRVLLPAMLAVDGGGAMVAAMPLPDGKGPQLTPEAERLAHFLADNAVDGAPDPGKLIKTISQLNLGRPSAGERAGGQAVEPLSSLRNLDSPAAQKLVRLLEAHTVVNQQPASGSDFFLFPVFFAEQAGRGEWLFSFEQGGGEAGSGLTSAISFYLSMSQLGDIHLRLNSRSDALTGVFTLTTNDAAAHVRQHLPQLAEALRPLGGTITLTCRTAPIDCLKILKDDLTAQAGMERFALIDVKA